MEEYVQDLKAFPLRHELSMDMASNLDSNSVPVVVTQDRRSSTFDLRDAVVRDKTTV